MFRNTFFLHLLASIFFSGTLCGQQDSCLVRVSGQILDSHDGSPLGFATVFIQETGTGTQASESGQFTLDSVCKGKMHFLISHVGCESKSLFIHITKDTFVLFDMEHHALLLDEVEISGVQPQSKVGITRQMLHRDNMLESAGLTIGELAGRVNGVRVLRAGPGLGKPMIQGISGNRVGVVQYGIPLESQQWGNDHAPEVDAETGDRLVVVLGAETVKYGGNVVGGLISIEPVWEAPDPHWHGLVRGMVQSNGRKAGIQALLKRNTDKLNLRFSANIQKAGDLHTPDYYLTNTGFTTDAASAFVTNSISSKHHWRFLYSYYGSEQGLLKGSHIGSLTDLEEAIRSQTPRMTADRFSYQIDAPRQQVSHHVFSAEQIIKKGEGPDWHIKAGLQANLRREFDIRRVGRDAQPSLDLLLLSQFLDISLAENTSRENRGWQAGVQFKYGNNTNRPGTGVSPLIPDYLHWQAAIYGMQEWSGKKWQADAGLRGEIRWYDTYLVRNSQFVENIKQSFSLLAVNGGIRNKITESLAARTEISVTRRPPDINELYSQGLHQGVSGIEEGNASLKAETAIRVAHEWNGEISHEIQFQATAFYQYFNNFIYLRPDGSFRLTVRGAFPVFKYMADDVSMAGVGSRFVLQASPSWHFIQQADYVYARNHSSGTGLVRIPPFLATSTIQYLRDRLSWCRELKVQLETSYTGRQTLASSAGDFLPPPPSYWLVHGMVRMKWKQKNGHDIHLILRMENVFNITYRDYLNRLRYFADEPGRNLSATFQINF